MTTSTVCTRKLATVLCTVALLPGNSFGYIVSASPPVTQAPSPPTSQAQRIPADQLDSLVSPIALYPDPLLAQTLAASTYPVELLQLQQWLAKNPALKDQALRDAVAKQPWDPSVQAMAGLPDVVKRLADDIQWTTDLGNAFLAQESDVMNAVQRMRQKAQRTGNLKTTPEQKVEEQVVENKQVIVIEQANPQVVYVPSYDPVVVYGPPVYPYPSIYYPPAGYYAAGAAISFGAGVAMGAFWGGGGWGWGAGWGHNDITVNRNNSFNRAANINGGNRNIGNTWQHNAVHRGGTPYRDNATANRYGGTARGDSLANRQAGARQQVAHQGGNLRSNGTVGTSGLGARAGANNLGDRNGLNNRAGAGAAGRPGAGGADRVGSRDLSRGHGGGSAVRPNGGASVHPQSRGGGSRSSFGGGHRSGGSSGMSRGGGGHRGGGGSRGGSRGGGGRRYVFGSRRKT